MKLIGNSVAVLLFLLALGTYRTEALQEKPEIWQPNTKVYPYGVPGNGENDLISYIDPFRHRRGAFFGLPEKAQTPRCAEPYGSGAS